MYAKTPRLLSRAHLENGTYEHIVSHPRKKLELNGLEAPDELQIMIVTQQLTEVNPEKPKPTCHHGKMRGRYRNKCRQIKRVKDQAQNNTNSTGNSNNNSGGQRDSNSNNKTSNNINTSSADHRNDRKTQPVYPS